ARTAIQLRKRLKTPHIPVVSRGHGYDIFSKRKASNYLPQRELLFTELAQIMTASAHGQKYLEHKYPAFARKFSTRHLGVPEALSAGNPDQEQFTIYTCAYLVPVKRIPLLIDAIQVLQDQGIDAVWKHIG